MTDNTAASQNPRKNRTLPEKIAILRHRTQGLHERLGDEPSLDDCRASAHTSGWEFWWSVLGFRLGMAELMIVVLVLGAALGLLAARLRRDNYLEWAAVTAAKTGVQLGYTKDHEVQEACWRHFLVPRSPALVAPVQISDEDIAFLRAYDRLEVLDMEAAVMTDAGLAAIGALPRLRRVSCVKPRITDRGLAYLRESTNLKSLRLLGARELTDAGLVHLTNLTNLEELNLSSARIAGPGLAHLAGMRRLRSLVIAGAPLTDAGLAQLGRLSSLRELSIGGGEYTEAGLSHITGLPRLEVLQLNGPQVTDAWLERLAGNKTLRQLHLAGTRVSDIAIERLKSARPQLQIARDRRLK